MIRPLFTQITIGTRFITAYGHDVYVKVSDTDAARLYGSRDTLYTAPYRPTEEVRLFAPGHAFHGTLLDLSRIRLVPKATVAPGTLLGHVTVDDTATYRQTMEVAAWFRDHKAVPGTYPVYSGGLGQYGVPIYYAEIPSIITDACLVSLFGGVRYGNDDAGQREIGTSSSWRGGNDSYDHKEGVEPFEGRAGFTFVALGAEEGGAA